MLCRKMNLLLTLVGLALLLGSECYAQTASNSQKFRVTVSSQFSVTPPSSLELITYDGTSPATFAPQSWQVISNASNGATLTMSTNQAFTNVDTPVDGDGTSYKRDAALSLAKASGAATWAVTTASQSTDYAGGNETATVVAASKRAGAASFELTVTMIDPDFNDLAAGNYEMTVTGTLTAN